MPTRRKFRRNNRNKNKSRRKRQRGGDGVRVTMNDYPPNYSTENLENFQNNYLYEVLKMDKYEAVCPKKTGTFAKGKRNGTDKCNDAKNELDKFFEWFKQPRTEKIAVDAGWIERNKKETWYKDAYLHAFGTPISNLIKAQIKKQLYKKKLNEVDTNYLYNIDKIINSPYLIKYGNKKDPSDLPEGEGTEIWDDMKKKVEEQKNKAKANTEIKNIMNVMKPENIENYTQNLFKNGTPSNPNYTGAIWRYKPNMSWNDSWKEVIKIMDVDGFINDPEAGDIPNRKGWKGIKKLTPPSDPYKREELYNNALKKFEELFENFKTLIMHYHENKIKLLEDQATQAETVGNSEDEAEKTSEMNEEKKALKNIDKEMAQFKPLFIIFTYIFLPGHIWNKLNKKTDDKPGLDAYGLKESVLVHSFEELRNLSEKYKINKDDQKKDGNIIFHTDINFIDEFINVIENHFRDLKKNDENDAILQSIDTELKNMDDDGNISFFHTPQDGATIKNNLKITTITGEEKNLAPIIKFHIIRFLRHIVQTPELEHKWCSIENKKGIRISDLKKAKIAKYKYKLTGNDLTKEASGVEKCPKKGGRKTRRRRRKRKRKKTRRRRRRRR